MLQSSMLKTLIVTRFIVLLGSIGIFFISSAVLADQNSISANNRLNTYYSWLNSPWSNDDTIYQTLRNKIDLNLAKSSAPMLVVQQYKAKYEKKTTDPQALFAYCYSVYKTTGSNKGANYIQSQINSGILYKTIAYSHVQIPHTYNYARLAFLETAFFRSPRLISVGKRLIKHSPGDNEVEMALATVLTFSTAPADRSLALKYQQDLATRFPKQPGPYQLLGLLYYRTAWLNHSQEDANKSVAAYQQALDLSPKNNESSSEYRDIIDFIKNLQVQWKQNK